MPAVGVITFELRLDDVAFLKDKRHYVKSLKDRLRAKFNVAVAEIDYQDLWQRALISAVTVSPNHAHAEQVLQSVEREAASQLGAALVNTTIEWIGMQLCPGRAIRHATQNRTSFRKLCAKNYPN